MSEQRDRVRELAEKLIKEKHSHYSLTCDAFERIIREELRELLELLDELKMKATGLPDETGFNVTYDVPAGLIHRLLAWRDGAIRKGKNGI